MYVFSEIKKTGIHFNIVCNMLAHHEMLLNLKHWAFSGKMNDMKIVV